MVRGSEYLHRSGAMECYNQKGTILQIFKYNNAKRSIPAFVNDAHPDLQLLACDLQNL